MKKIKFIFSLLIAFTVLFSACSQQEELGEKFQESTKVSLDLKINKGEIIQNKAGALPDPDGFDYCPESLAEALPSGGTIMVSYSGTFYDAEIKDPSSIPTTVNQIGTALTGENVTYPFTQVDFTGSADAFMSDLIDIDFPDRAKSLVLEISDFRVYLTDPTVEGAKPAFITPTSESAYAGYVSTPVSQKFVVDLYEKKYIEMDVLCFDEEKIPEFGFNWYDFNVVQGQEVCVFFNCMGNTASTYHQLFAGEVFAYQTGQEETTNYYWSGANYVKGETPSDMKPFCIPCPGDWKVNGMYIDVYPAWNSTSTAGLKYYLSPDMIQAFLDFDKTDGDKEPWPELDLTNYTSVTTLILDDANGVPFIHFTLDDCFKSDAFYSDFVGASTDEVTESDIYAVNYDLDGSAMSNFNVEYAFTVPGKAHLAMTPDQSKLVIVEQNATGTDSYAMSRFSYYDIYSLERVVLKPTPQEGHEYNFNQLVYTGGTLYAGCSGKNCLVPVYIDWNTGTWTFGADIIVKEANIAFSGGDLISAGRELDAAGALVCVSKPDAGGSGGLIKMNLDGGIEKYLSAGASVPGFDGCTGSSMVYNPEKEITGDSPSKYTGVLTATSVNAGANSGLVGFYYFNGGEEADQVLDFNSSAIIKKDRSDVEGYYFMRLGGDMASPYNTLAQEELPWATFRAFFPTLTEPQP